MVLLDALGTLLLSEEPLAGLATLDTLTSLEFVMAFFPGLLTGFLAYCYTWYCFPVLFNLENRMQTIPLEAFFSELG